MTERVTIEQNGERFVLEVPDGMSDSDIQNYVTQQQSGAGNIELTQAPANPVDNIATQAAIMTPSAVNQYIEKSPTIANAREAVNMAENVATKVNPAGVQEMLKNPIQTAKAFVSNLPLMNAVRNPVATAGTVARGVGGVVADPLNLATLPYNMAAYEQAKIRANPTAPEYATTPYAQAYRGEYTTQGAAGAANRRNAIAMAPTGYTPTPNEALNLLQSGDTRMINLYGGQQKLQNIAATSANAPPTALNFIDRMKRLAGQYSAFIGQ